MTQCINYEIVHKNAQAKEIKKMIKVKNIAAILTMALVIALPTLGYANDSADLASLEKSLATAKSAQAARVAEYRNAFYVIDLELERIKDGEIKIGTLERRIELAEKGDRNALNDGYKLNFVDQNIVDLGAEYLKARESFSRRQDIYIDYSWLSGFTLENILRVKRESSARKEKYELAKDRRDNPGSPSIKIEAKIILKSLVKGFIPENYDYWKNQYKDSEIILYKIVNTLSRELSKNIRENGSMDEGYETMLCK